MSSGYEALKARMFAIHKLLQEADVARRLPDVRERMAMGVQPDTYSMGNSSAVHEAFKQCRARFAAEERRHGEIACVRELRRIAHELDKLRADLPDLAAAARFDLLDAVREMRS